MVISCPVLSKTTFFINEKSMKLPAPANVDLDRIKGYGLFNFCVKAIFV